MLPAKNPSPVNVDWLPAERLGQFSVEPQVRSWLIGKGLLTQRLRAVCGERYAFRMAEQTTALLDLPQKQFLKTADQAALIRDVEMLCDDKLWVFARTLMPDSTLNAHPWLGELGDSALGETLNDLSGVERSSYEYAWMPAGHSLADRALRDRDDTPAGVWARRSRIALRGAPLLVQELFLPGMGGV
jgi:chorismate--pyruvate lyase